MKTIDSSLITAHNEAQLRHVRNDYAHLGEQLARRHIDIEAVRQQVAAFGVAIPSWGVGTGGTRFARFPGQGEPRHVFDKLQDCGVIQQLARATPTLALLLMHSMAAGVPGWRRGRAEGYGGWAGCYEGDEH